jgi:hypothetical protein
MGDAEKSWQKLPAPLQCKKIAKAKALLRNQFQQQIAQNRKELTLS